MNQAVLESKKLQVKEIADILKANTTLIVAEYRGLSVADISDLRKALAAEDATFSVYKNSMVERAAKELGYEGLDEILAGPNGFIVCNDVIKGPKVVAKFARYHEELVIKGGVADGKFVTADQVKTLAKLPGREGLLSMLCSVLQAPIRNLAFAVKSIAEKQN